MNKNRMILAVSGGVIGLAVLATAYLTWSTYSAKNAALDGDEEEGTDGLNTVTEKAQTLSHKGVYPCAESVKKIDANAERVVAWRNEALKLASRGDRPVRKLTPAQFKADLVAEAKRLSSLPGAVNGVLVKPDFAFGPFAPYIVEGKMPAEAELALLLRRWDDVTMIVETLAACGVAELANVEFKAAAAEGGNVNEQQPKKAKRPAKKKAGAAKPTFAPASETYVFTFKARGTAFAKVVNALATAERFIVVDDFSIQNAADPIGEALGGVQKREQAASGGGRRRRRGGAAAVVEEKKDDSADKKNGIVTDPQTDPPFTVTLTATVSDFKSLEEDAKVEEGGK